MKLKEDQEDWNEGEVIQYVTTENPAFLWFIKTKMNAFMVVKGRDKFIDGKGQMLIKLNSVINIVKEEGEKIDEAALQRYLAEILWYPTMAISEYIEWEEIDENSAKATLTYGGTSGSGTFFFDENGNPTEFSALRYKGNEPDSKRYKWIVSIFDYSSFDGITVPTHLNITWELENNDWTWYETVVDNIVYNEVFEK